MSLLEKLFKPDLILDKIEYLEMETFKKQGYKAIILDLDNTLAPYYVKKIDDHAYEVINTFKRAGFKVLVFSNNSSKRVGTFVEGTDIPYLCYALKPTPIGYWRAKKLLKVKLNECISIGDQLLTDVLGSKRVHVFSIYVRPLVQKDSLSTRFNRFFEKKIFKRLGL